MKTKMDSQKGQVIILFVLALVGLLAFAGLAIDAAMVYSDRRFDQSIADDAALAAGGMAGTSFQVNRIYHCADLTSSVQQDIITAAITRASISGFMIDDDITDQHGVDVVCDATKDSMDITVQITSQTQTSFVHLVNSQPIRNSVTAVVRVKLPGPAGGGAGIIALNKTVCKQGGQYVGGVYLDGTNFTVEADGGGISSNTCIEKNGSSEVVVRNSNPAAHSAWWNTATIVDENGDPATIIQNDANYDVQMQISIPDCTGLTEYASPDYSQPLNPGIYPNGIQNDATLNPGLYCIDAAANGKTGNLTGQGVTLYIRSGSVNWNTGYSNLAAPLNSDPDPSPAISGLLFYFANGGFTMLGNSTADLSGMIYAPQGTIELGGTPTSNTWYTLMVGNNVKIHGNPFASLVVDYNRVTIVPPSLDLNK